MADPSIPAGPTMLDLAHAGEARRAAAAADDLLAGDPDEAELALAALTLLQCGRYDTVKRLAPRLEGARTSEAKWAHAALAVAFDPTRAAAAIVDLSTIDAESVEYRLLAGVAAHHEGDHARAERLLAVPRGMSEPVYVTAAAIGITRAARTDLPSLALYLVCAVGGFVCWDLRGAVVGVLVGLLVIARRARGRFGHASRELARVKAPPERRNRRERLRLAGLVSLTSATWIVAAFAYAFFANR